MRMMRMMRKGEEFDVTGRDKATRSAGSAP